MGEVAAMTMPHWQLRFVADAATAVKWALEDRMLTKGEPFEQAKEAAIKQASTAWKGLTPDTRDAVWTVCMSLTPADLSPSTVRELNRRWKEQVAAYHAPLRWYDRLMLRWFGCVW